MAKKQKSKKGKNRRVSPEKKASYWNVAHALNMVRRHRRILSSAGRSEADRFVALHRSGCLACKNTLAARVRKAT